MARQALKDFPGINFAESIMAGDTLTDLQFGIQNGMKTVYLNTNNIKLPSSNYVASFNSLIEFAQALPAND
jgi:histidinol phosphatase-like enzyme